MSSSGRFDEYGQIITEDRPYIPRSVSHEQTSSSQNNNDNSRNNRNLSIWKPLTVLFFIVVIWAYIYNPTDISLFSSDSSSNEEVQEYIPQYFSYPDGFEKIVDKKFSFNSLDDQTITFSSKNYPQVLHVNYYPGSCEVDKVVPNQPQDKIEYVSVTRTCSDAFYRIIITDLNTGEEWRMGLVDYRNSEKIFLNELEIAEAGSFNVKVEGRSADLQLTIERPEE